MEFLRTSVLVSDSPFFALIYSSASALATDSEKLSFVSVKSLAMESVSLYFFGVCESGLATGRKLF